MRIRLAALALATSALVACTSATGPSATGENASTAVSAPKVQKLVMALPPPAVEANNLTEAAHTSFWQVAPMYEYLVGLTAEGKELVPQLATEWSLEPDGKSYRFKLRHGVPFHNGFGEFTAKDVRYTWQMLSNGEPAMIQGQNTYMTLIKDATVVNDYEVVLNAATPDAGFLVSISQAENIFPQASKNDGESRGKGWKLPSMLEKPYAGTGPYQYVSRQQSSNLAYKRPAEAHWRQTPDFPEFEFRFAKENSTRQAALLAKEVQMAVIPPDLAKSMEQSGFKTVEGRAAGLHIFGRLYGAFLNTRHDPAEVLNPDPNATYVFPNSPFLDVNVRKALNKAINRDALNKAFIRGKGQPIYLEYYHPDRPGWNPDWQKNFQASYGYDVDGARKALADAGYTPARPLDITVEVAPNPLFSGAPDVAEALGNYWQAAGFKVTLDTADPTSVAAKRRALTLPELDRRVAVFVTSARQLLGVGVFNSAMRLTRGGVQLPEMEEVYKQIVVTLDSKKQGDLWRKWGDMAYERYLNIPLFWLPAEIVVDPAVVQDYVFPGSISGTYTHVEYTKAVR